MELISEITKTTRKNIKYLNKKDFGHYIKTPYSYQPRIAKKYTLPSHIDLGQGILQTLEYLINNKDK